MSTILFICGLNSNSKESNSLVDGAKNFFERKKINFVQFRCDYLNIGISDLHKKIQRKLNDLDDDIYVIGYSMGAVPLIVSGTKSKIKKMILWEASMNPYDVLINSKNIYNLSVKSQVLEDAKKYRNLDSFLRQISVPTLMVGAGKAGYRLTEKYFNLLRFDSNLNKKEIISEANHNFSHVESNLFKKTFNFIKKPPQLESRSGWLKRWI